MPIKTKRTGARRPFTTQLVAQGGYGEQTLTGSFTLDRKSAQWLRIDPGGASRDLTLPAVEDGLFFHIVNAADAAENLVVKNQAAATIVTINQNEEAIVISDATGWKLLRVATIALS